MVFPKFRLTYLLLALSITSYSCAGAGFSGPASTTDLFKRDYSKEVTLSGNIIERISNSDFYLIETSTHKTISVEIPKNIINSYSISPSTPVSLKSVERFYIGGSYILAKGLKVTSSSKD